MRLARKLLKNIYHFGINEICVSGSSRYIIYKRKKLLSLADGTHIHTHTHTRITQWSICYIIEMRARFLQNAAVCAPTTSAYFVGVEIRRSRRSVEQSMRNRWKRNFFQFFFPLLFHTTTR